MWKLDFFLLPSNDYQGIGIDEVRNLEDNINYLQENELVYIPNEFYNKEDKNQITAIDYIYGTKQNDITDYLLDIISKQKQCQDTYEDLKEKVEFGYLAISHGDITDEVFPICIESTKNRQEEKYVEVNDVIKVKRYYLEKNDSYEIYEKRSKDCFPDIVFHKDAFQHINRLGKGMDVVKELTRHLSILNDVGKKLYEYNGRNEKTTLDELKSAYKIECSGKGSKEEKMFNKDITYHNIKYQLTCNPHTKLFKKHTDQRIYFCWGRDEIKEHSIIVVRIGNHWQE